MAKKYTSNNAGQSSKQNRENKVYQNIGSKQFDSSHSPLQGWLGIIISIAFIFTLTLAGSMDNTVEKWTGLFSAVLALVLLIVVRKNSSTIAYRTPLFLAFTAYIIWGGISTLYAASGKFAIFEFSKLLFAFCIYLIVLFFTGSEESGFKKIAYILASAGGFFGLISIDAASAGSLTKIFRSFIGLFTDIYANRGGFEEGIRITGIFGNPNIYAGFMALAVLFSLYLTISASNRKQAIFSTVLLAVNALSYLLAFSLGSLFMFLIACLIMIGISDKGKRIRLFILMAETAFLGLLFAFISMAGLGKSGAVAFIPLAGVILNAILLYFVDKTLRPRLLVKLEQNKKLPLRVVAVIVVIIAVYAVAAFNVSGTLTLAENESVMRAIYISGGDYELKVESTSPIKLSIESQNENDLMRHTSSKLYTGTSQQEVTFTVPDDSKIVMINFTGGQGGTELTSAKYSGASQGDIHMNYPLLPNIIANRLQNIFANENAVQRGIFFEDGLKLFSKSPVIGRGLGGYENGIYGVQDFYYETKYAHNHYIQALSDLGIVGLVLFLCILIASVVSVVGARRHKRSLFAIPVLAACVFQIFGQAITDATWSTGVFLGFAAAILALITIYCSTPLTNNSEPLGNWLPILEKSILLIFTSVFVVLLSGNLYAQAHAKAGVESFDDIERLILFDRFEYNDYKISYIVNAPKSEDSEVLAQADRYAAQLINVPSNSIAPYIMAYDFETYKDVDAFNAAMKGIEYAKSSPYMWSKIFSICEEYIDPVGPYTDNAADRLKTPKYYIDNVLKLYDALIERNSNSLDKLTLNPYNNAFVGKLLEIKATNQYSIDWVFTAIMSYAFDSECAVDTDLNGIPDSISVKSGSISRNQDGLLSVSKGTVLNLSLYHKLHGSYTFKVKTDTSPQGIKITLNGEDLKTAYNEDEAYAVIDLADNSERKLSNFTVTFPQAAVIDEITYITELNF